LHAAMLISFFRMRVCLCARAVAQAFKTKWDEVKALNASNDKERASAKEAEASA
jgi:hypothetical protein